MVAISTLGAVLLIFGIVYMARATMNSGRLSEPHQEPTSTADITLEPRRRGMSFLGVGANWPGLVMVVVGAVLLLVPLVM